MTATFTSSALVQIDAPEAIEVIPAREIETRIDAARAELANLEHQLSELLAEAEALEELRAQALRPTVLDSVTIRFVQFLEELRAESNQEISSLMQVAADQTQRRRGLRMNWQPLLASASRTEDATASVALQWAPTEAPEPAPTTPPAAVVLTDARLGEPGHPVVAGSGRDDQLEAEFWSDEPLDDGGNRLSRVVRTVAFQAAAVLLVIFVVLLRIG